MFNVVIFSLNRACQLDLFLRSWQRFGYGVVPQILYCYTDEEFRQGYTLVQSRFPSWACWWPQVQFRVDCLAMISPDRPYTVFFVDDQVFRRRVVFGPDLTAPLEHEEVSCISLRLSPLITYCYSLNRSTPPPEFRHEANWLCWTWPNLPGDWGYPMSCDGHIFRTSDVLPLMRRLNWANPNTLEAALASEPLKRTAMVCRSEHATLNVPTNLVQNTFTNRIMRNGMPADDLNREYLRGRMIDLEPLLRLDTHACHVETEYRLIP
jgi:hypothetical protein